MSNKTKYNRESDIFNVKDSNSSSTNKNKSNLAENLKSITKIPNNYNPPHLRSQIEIKKESNADSNIDRNNIEQNLSRTAKRNFNRSTNDFQTHTQSDISNSSSKNVTTLI